MSPPPQATPSGDAAARGPRLAHPLDVLSEALAILVAGRPRTFADVPAATVCRGSAAERVQCHEGAGACPREFNCFS